MKDIRDELKEIMEEKGLSPEEVSKFIGCSGQQVRRWIKKENKPSLIYKQAIRRGIKKIKRVFK